MHFFKQGKMLILPLFCFSAVLFPCEKNRHESTGIFGTMSKFVLNNYRENSKYSISRCPFKTSCSNYFEKSIRDNGAISGTLEFIDRYYYREHRYNFTYYSLFIDKSNNVKINDDINLNLWNYLNY